MESAPRELKVVGHRKPGTGTEAAARLLRLIVELRGGRPFIPRGVHRFRSFEEAQEGSMKRMARPSSHDRPPSKT